MKSLQEKCEDIIITGEAESGKEGLERTRAQRPDVVIIDIGLDDISGLEVGKKISQELPNTKIIFLTSHTKETEILEALKIGANAYVLKDIEDEMLVMILKSVSKGAMWLDPKIVPFFRDKNCGLIPTRQLSRGVFKVQ